MMEPNTTATAIEPAVVCRGVSKTFGDGDSKVHALRGVDIEVLPGAISLLVGPSGCGKTTLISIVAGLLDPTDGEVHVLGHRIDAMKSRHLVPFRGENIGFVFQQYNLLPALTAAENAAVPLLVAGWRRGKAVRKAREVLDAVGLADRANALPSQLSGGQQQRVAIARALVHDPRLLVCDEPTAALDAKSGQNVMELFSRVAVQNDRAVIIVTHDNRVFHFGERIFHMSDGRIERVEGRGERGARSGEDIR
ncbi:MAG: ABC transporter ATP-binding protein [Planctomycetota bacterium]|nr:MAG: ABC transporter ATP-binding protein [Planctomycetota bacterium]